MSRSRAFRAVLACGICALVACGDDDVTTRDSGPHEDMGIRIDGGPGTDTGPTPDAGPVPDAGPMPDTGPTPDTGPAPDMGPGVDAGPTTGCPPTPPSGACPIEGRICEYGDRYCPTTATCTRGTWSIPDVDCAPMPAECPASREAAAGTACTAAIEGGICEYADRLFCTCTSCPVEFPVCMVVDPPQWACEAPNPDPECPPGQAQLGAACNPEGKICDYGCQPGRRRVCTDGIWVSDSSPGGCPMSTRRAKRDIEYLNPAEVDNLARELSSSRLATYEYTDPALAGRRRLGFILEDQPTSYATDPERSQVDLYGYTSMLVAALQSQERRIESLERQLARARSNRRASPGR